MHTEFCLYVQTDALLYERTSKHSDFGAYVRPYVRLYGGDVVDHQKVLRRIELL